MTPAPLTQRQTEILAYIRDCQQRRGFPPTRAEIARHFRFRSANAAEQHLRALARKGVLELIPGTSRGLRPLAEPAGIPIVGRVAAGDPILAAEHIEGYCAIGADLFNPPADYLLRIQGESMRDAGILDGDLLAVHKTELADDGAIVVARIDEEVTVKRLRRTADPRYLRLLPENPDFSPIEVDLAVRSFAIEGVSLGLIRTRPV
ncbi:MAG: transcriptional repressor LexA [Pseudomonadota bacterium]|jgi:repressor LexA